MRAFTYIQDLSNVDLPRGDIDRLDEIDNAVYDICKLFTEDPNLEWDAYYIGDIAEFIATVMVKYGKNVRYPAIVELPNNECYIEQYHMGWRPGGERSNE